MVSGGNQTAVVTPFDDIYESHASHPVHLTDPFYDIDVAADLSHLAQELQRMPGKAPRTAKWLSEWASAECE
jgi:hypothetical protein